MMKMGSNVRFKTKSRVDLDVTKYITHLEDAIDKGNPWVSPIFFPLYHEITSIYMPNRKKRKKSPAMKNVFEDIDMMCNLSSTIADFIDGCSCPKLDKDYFHAVRKTLK